MLLGRQADLTTSRWFLTEWARVSAPTRIAAHAGFARKDFELLIGLGVRVSGTLSRVLFPRVAEADPVVGAGPTRPPRNVVWFGPPSCYVYPLDPNSSSVSYLYVS